MLQPEFQSARAALAATLDSISPTAKHVAMFDVDADGVCAGVVWNRLLERLGHRVTLVLPNRERNAWSPANRERLKQQNPDFLWVLDLGSRSEKVLEGVAAGFIDHHRPEGSPPDDLLISGYEWDPVPNTSWMTWELGREMVDLTDSDWIAVIGTLSDLGERAPFPLLNESKQKYTAKWLKEATALVNAPRRSSQFNPEAALRALQGHSNPREMCESASDDVKILVAARAEVAAEMTQAKKSAPTFAGDVALLRVNSPCQIHPLMAQIWRGRLPKYHVICANEGYIPGRINFSARSARGSSVLDKLKSIELSDGEGHFGHGHDQASGGSLPPERWNELLGKLGFADSARFGS